QPRAFFDEESLAGLAASIAAVGVLQPVLVREVSPQKFELIAGERRWRCACAAPRLFAAHARTHPQARHFAHF
ncbi:MAG: chromosome partitioning protein ParB, partial [Betaproteobacteria bacterium]|nr:chromosome partitioning protein ParB [Betaproteobacteria bacterium]